jgi:hypothetical protein
MPSPLHDADYRRKRAREVRSQAQQMSDPETKHELLKTAAIYDRLANLAEGEKSYS